MYVDINPNNLRGGLTYRVRYLLPTGQGEIPLCHGARAPLTSKAARGTWSASRPDDSLQLQPETPIKDPHRAMLQLGTAMEMLPEMSFLRQTRAAEALKKTATPILQG